MKKLVVGLVALASAAGGVWGAGRAESAELSLAVRLRLPDNPAVPPSPCVGAAVRLGDPATAPAGSGLIVVLTLVDLAPIAVGEHPPSPCADRPLPA